MKPSLFLFVALGLAGVRAAPVPQAQPQNVCDEKLAIRNCVLVRRGDVGQGSGQMDLAVAEQAQKAKEDQRLLRNENARKYYHDRIRVARLTKDLLSSHDDPDKAAADAQKDKERKLHRSAVLRAQSRQRTPAQVADDKKKALAKRERVKLLPLESSSTPQAPREPYTAQLLPTVPVGSSTLQAASAFQHNQFHLAGTSHPATNDNVDVSLQL